MWNVPARFLLHNLAIIDNEETLQKRIIIARPSAIGFVLFRFVLRIEIATRSADVALEPRNSRDLQNQRISLCVSQYSENSRVSGLTLESFLRRGRAFSGCHCS